MIFKNYHYIILEYQKELCGCLDYEITTPVWHVYPGVTVQTASPFGDHCSQRDWSQDIGPNPHKYFQKWNLAWTPDPRVIRAWWWRAPGVFQIINLYRKFHSSFQVKKLRTYSKNFSKRIEKRAEKLREHIKKGIQKTLFQFINREMQNRCVPRLKTPMCKIRPDGRLSEMEQKAYKHIQNYRGELPHLFLFYPWERLRRFDSADREYPVDSVMKAHVIMCKKRIPTYTNLITELQEKPMLLKLCGIDTVPSRKIISRAVDTYGIQVFRFLFHDLAKKCLKLGLMRGRFIGFDGSLLESNCNPYKNKETGRYTDPGAGLYIRGNYIKGVGYLYIEAMDLEYGQLMLLKTYNGSSNENPLFREVLDDFHRIYGFYPELMSIDKGSDSEKNRSYCGEGGIEAYIQARDYGNNKAAYTPKNKCFKEEDLEGVSTDFLERIADRRSESERGHARNKWGYRRFRMPNRGPLEAESYVLVTGATTLLTALTAHHAGRPDLIRSSTAFSRITPETNI